MTDELHSRPWLNIVGIGEEGFNAVLPAGRQRIKEASVIYGGSRHLDMLPATIKAELRLWNAPFADNIKALKIKASERQKGESICILASGDPMSYGIGATLSRIFGRSAMAVIPAVGAFSHAAAQMGWALGACDCLTLHGRPMELLQLHLRPEGRLLVLSSNGKTPQKVARYLSDQGFGQSQITLLANLGGAKFKRYQALAENWTQTTNPDLNTLAIQLKSGPDARWYSPAYSLPDDLFQHDGQLTKREMRALTLSNLKPFKEGLLWDIGSGCGAIAIEWMRAGGQAIAVENHPQRLTFIAGNAHRLGVPGLQIIEGTAPGCLAGLPRPDAVFVGGGLTADNLFDSCWKALKTGGIFAANAVTMEGEACLGKLHEKYHGELSRLQSSRLTPVGRLNGWKPFMPVTLYHTRKDFADG